MICRPFRALRTPLLAASVGLLALAPHVSARSASPPVQKTNAPGDTGNCTGGLCHNSTLNDPAGQITGELQESGVPFTEYVPGTVYTLSFVLGSGRTDRRRWGFEMTSLDGTGARTGTFASTTAFTSLQTAGGRQYMGHLGSPGTFPTNPGPVTWTFSWTAPPAGPTGAPTVTFYWCANAANNNNGSSGDFIACRTVIVTPAAAPVDTDGDTLLDSEEAAHRTNPADADTDDDGISDGD